MIGKPKLLTQPPQMDIAGFLTGLVSNSPEVKEMREAMEQLYKDNSAKEQTIKVLEQNNRRDNLALREWQAANEMQVQLEVLANSAAVCAEQSANASVMIAHKAKECLQLAKERLAKSGMSMMAPTVHNPMSDEQTIAWGKRLAPEKQNEVILSKET
jgi:hypothetical protein